MSVGAESPIPMKVSFPMGIAAGLTVFVAVGVAAPQQQPVFRASTDAVPLLVAATTGGGDLVTDLAADDFEVLDNGQLASIVAFAPRAAPVALRVLTAQGPRMRDDRERSRDVALSLIDQALPSEPFGISGGDARLNAYGPFTSDKAVLREELARTFQPVSGEGSFWWDAIGIASNLLRRPLDSVAWKGIWMGSGQPVWSAGELPGVRALVVLSPGIDDLASRPVYGRTNPRTTPQAYAWRVVLEGTIVIGLGFNGKGNDKNLVKLANESSGWYVDVTSRTVPQELAAAVWKDLRNRYLLGFVPNAFDGKEHTLTVKVKRPGVVVRARTAYTAPKPQ